MTRASDDEPGFIRSFESALWNSCGDAASVARTWAAYEEDIARLSPAGQTELQRLRLAREKELKGKAA